jgi:L,D-transpeptidase YbiS
MKINSRIKINISEQKLFLYHNDVCVKEYLVSTALKGAGEHKNTDQTPRGLHEIVEKIGGEYPKNAVFVGRNFTNEIYSDALAQKFPERDWILTRILWLSGKEPGKNLDGDVDTKSRYIYIHGTPDTNPMGVPLSHGCIRMHSDKLMDLFEKVEVGALVEIVE